MKKAKLWAHATYEMVEHGDFSKRLNLPAYVRAENYDFIYQRCENMEAENARLKAEVERLAMAGNQSIAVGTKLREMVGDHHWSLEFDRVRTDWYHASRGVLSRTQNPNTPPTAV
jgi:hypothetical protein